MRLVTLVLTLSLALLGCREAVVKTLPDEEVL